MIRLAEPQTGTMTYLVDTDATTLIAAYNADAATHADTPITFLERRGYPWERAGDVTTPQALAALCDTETVVAVWNSKALSLNAQLGKGN